MNIRLLFKREVGKQFIKFCLIGLESTVLNYLIFLILLHFLFVNYLIASAIGFISGTIFGFFFNKLWTFESKRKSKVEIGPYFLVYLFSLGVGLLALKFIVSFMDIKPIIANVPVLVLTTIINFFGTKILVFKNKKW